MVGIPNPPKMVPLSLKIALNDPKRKPLMQFAYEMMRYTFGKRELPTNYVHKFLYRNEVQKPNDYLSSRQTKKLRILATGDRGVPELDDKFKFNSCFKERVTLPAYFGHTDGGVFYNGDCRIKEISGVDDLLQIASQLLNGNRSSFFAKPIGYYGGIGSFKIGADTNFQELFYAIQDQDYIFQESVVQHPTLAAVYAPSVNTMRVIACVSPVDKSVRVACISIRFGRGGKCVDNISSGGIRAAVDINTGMICSPGSEDIHLGGRIYERHPDSGAAFVGVKIPFFQECLETAMAAAKLIDCLLVGWDIAVGVDGPVLIEGNSRPNHHGNEVANGPYVNNPVLKSFIWELTGGKGL